MPTLPWFERAMTETTINQENGCWEYQGTITEKGYGRISHLGQLARVHRLSFSTFVGDVPAGMMVCHACDVRNCWRPSHLFLGTAKDNYDDMRAKGRATPPPHKPSTRQHVPGFGCRSDHRGERNPKAKLTKHDVLKIRELRSSGSRNKDIAVQFNVSASLVSEIVNRTVWSHV